MSRDYYHKQLLIKIILFQHKEKDETNQQKEMPVEDNKKYRHQRLLKKRVETLSSTQSRLEKQVQQLEKRLQTPAHYQRVTSNDILEEDLSNRVSALENNGRQAARALFNVSKQVGRADVQLIISRD